MEHTWEVVVGVVVVIVASLLFDFASVPTGAGKMGAYLSAALIPTLVIVYKKVLDSGIKLKPTEFVFAVILNSFLCLFFACVVLVLVQRF